MKVLWRRLMTDNSLCLSSLLQRSGAYDDNGTCHGARAANRRNDMASVYNIACRQHCVCTHCCGSGVTRAAFIVPLPRAVSLHHAAGARAFRATLFANNADIASAKTTFYVSLGAHQRQIFQNEHMTWKKTRFAAHATWPLPRCGTAAGRRDGKRGNGTA